MFRDSIAAHVCSQLVLWSPLCSFYCKLPKYPYQLTAAVILPLNATTAYTFLGCAAALKDCKIVIIPLVDCCLLRTLHPGSRARNLATSSLGVRRSPADPSRNLQGIGPADSEVGNERCKHRKFLQGSGAQRTSMPPRCLS